MITQHIVDGLKATPAVASLVADRIYPGSRPDAPTYPLLVVSKISAPGEATFDGDAGIERARMQVDVYAEGYADMVAVKRAVRAAMVARPPFGPPCVIDSVQCINDMDSPASAPIGPAQQAGPPKLRRRILEFIVWNVI